MKLKFKTFKDGTVSGVLVQVVSDRREFTGLQKDVLRDIATKVMGDGGLTFAFDERGGWEEATMLVGFTSVYMMTKIAQEYGCQVEID
jgi:hypothetical protein